MWATNLACIVYGAALPFLLGYGLGSLAYYHDWHFYVLVTLAVALVRVGRWEGAKA